MTAFGDLCPGVLAAWEERLYSTEPVDQAAASEALCELYDLAGLPQPRLVYVASSPLDAAVCWAMQARRDDDRHEALVRAMRLEWPRRGFGNREVMTPLWDQLATWTTRVRPVAAEDWFGTPSRAPSVTDLLLREPMMRLGAIVASGQYDPGRFLRDLLLDSSWTPDDAVARAGHTWPPKSRMFDLLTDIGICALYDLLVRLGLPTEAYARVTAAVGRQCPAVWFHRHMAIVSERPVTLSLDERGLLHGQDGPALGYRDGFGVYAWHGTVVSKRVIDPGLAIGELLDHPNAEERRVAIERLGWEEVLRANVLEKVGGPVPDPGNPGGSLELYSTGRGRGRMAERILRCRNGTPAADGVRREFMLHVPGDINDPIEAAAWTYGLDADDYAQTQRRT